MPVQRPNYVLVTTKQTGIFAPSFEYKKLTYLTQQEREQQEKIILELIAMNMIYKDEGIYRLAQKEKVIATLKTEQQHLEKQQKLHPLSPRDNHYLITFNTQIKQHEVEKAEIQKRIELLSKVIEEKKQEFEKLNNMRSTLSKLNSLEIQEKIITQLINTIILLKDDIDGRHAKLTKELTKTALMELEHLTEKQKNRALTEIELTRFDYLKSLKINAEILQETTVFYNQEIDKRISELAIIKDQLYTKHAQLENTSNIPSNSLALSKYQSDVTDHEIHQPPLVIRPK